MKSKANLEFFVVLGLIVHLNLKSIYLKELHALLSEVLTVSTNYCQVWVSCSTLKD